VSEQQSTIDALKIALQMEIDGKEFYQQAARESRDDLGKKLLNTLAGEEDIHRQVFQRIYEAISARRGWPDVDLKSDSGRNLRTVFARANSQSGAAIHAGESELEAVDKARKMEGMTYDFYQNRQRQASDPAEKEFYEKLAGQEQQHSLALSDYREYLVNPAGWLVNKEHPSLD
jgi:rubrerythrin